MGKTSNYSGGFYLIFYEIKPYLLDGSLLIGYIITHIGTFFFDAACPGNSVRRTELSIQTKRHSLPAVIAQFLTKFRTFLLRILFL